ncbi:MAG: cyclophilin-like fold protein [Eubacteriales bacterium]|nr:cyclophilin-like fold protein [Eubacteriales bacterium]
MNIKVNVNGTELIAALENNSSADALVEKLKDGNITVHMNDYANFEKVGSLGFRLPTNDHQYTTKPGDIILYIGNQLVFYYDRNSWNFTKLGEFQNVTKAELIKIFGKRDITAELSL